MFELVGALKWIVNLLKEEDAYEEVIKSCVLLGKKEVNCGKLIWK